MTFKSFFLLCFVSTCACLGVVSFLSSYTKQTAPSSAFMHVLKTQQLRCAYGLAGKPRFLFDTKNQKPVGGIQYEIMEEIAKLLHLEIIWDEVAGYGSFPENLKAHRQDMFCSTVWQSAARAHRVLLSQPTYFTPLYVVVRETDLRFDGKDFTALNQKNIRFSYVEGTTSEAVIRTSFPKATRHALSSGSDVSDPLLDVVTGKADAIIFNLDKMIIYNRNNPTKKLKAVQGLNPVRIYGESYAFDIKEYELREMINTALSELHSNGTIKRILEKYSQEFGNLYFLPAKKYEPVSQKPCGMGGLTALCRPLRG